MARRTITTNQLAVNDTVMLRGKVSFSRIASLIEGDELARSIERAKERNQKFFKTQPYFTLSLYDVGVIYEDPAKKTDFEVYAEESLYTSRNADRPGWHFTIEGVGHLPEVAQFDPETGVATQIIPKGELDNDLDVSIILRVYSTKMNNGVALQGVIVNEPIRYYNPSRLSRTLQEKGMIYKPLSAEELQTQAAEQEQEEAVVYEDAPAEPVSAPAGNPYEAQAPAPTHKAAVNPYAKQPAQKAEDGGIRWEPGDNN